MEIDWDMMLKISDAFRQYAKKSPRPIREGESFSEWSTRLRVMTCSDDPLAPEAHVVGFIEAVADLMAEASRQYAPPCDAATHNASEGRCCGAPPQKNYPWDTPIAAALAEAAARGLDAQMAEDLYLGHTHDSAPPAQQPGFIGSDKYGYDSDID